MIIGVAGHLCSGKDTVGRLLEEHGFLHVPLSDCVFREFELSGRMRQSRAERRKFANERRKRFGGNYFLKRAVEADPRIDASRNLVVSGIYCASEALYLIESLDGVLYGIEPMDSEIRWARLRNRHDELRDLLTHDEFEEVDGAECSGEHDHEPNVQVVLRLAHRLIDNSGSLETLRSAVSELVEDFGMSSHGRERDALSSAAVPGTSRPQVVSKRQVLDGYEANQELERRSRAFEFIRKYYSLSNLDERESALAPLLRPTHAVSEIGNQFAVKLVAAFLEPDPLKARREFSSISPSTTDEELALLLNDTEFLRCHEELSRHLASVEGDIHEAVVKNLKQAGEDDQRQFSRDRRRDLESVVEEGITILVDPVHVDILRAAQETVGHGSIPVLEVLKRERIFEVSGFPDSKVSTAIHDAVDHGWLFSLLEQRKLFEKYKELFDSIGNPEVYGIFRREGEAVASIGFGVRYWAETQPGFTPLYSLADLAAAMDRHYDDRSLGDLHCDAYVWLRHLARNPSLRESQSLAFVFSNYLVELDEQRRKHGRIKVLDSSSHRVVGELDPWGPDYLSFFIEAHRQLLDSHNKHRDTLLRVHLLVEEYLMSQAALEGGSLRIPIGQLAEIDVSETAVPGKRISWMARHYGFTAFREPLI